MEKNNSLYSKFIKMIESDENHFFDSHEYEEIIDYYSDKGEFEIAEKVCTLASNQYPYSPTILARKAQLSILLENVEKSIKEIHTFLELNGFDENLLYILASHYSMFGKMNKSIQCLDKVKAEYGESTELYYQIGTSYFIAEQYTKAIENFKISLKLDVENEDALYDLAFCLELEDKLKESITFYQNFIDNDPYSCYAWYNLGIIHNKLLNFEEAINCFEFSYTIKEDFSSAYYNLGNSYVCIKEWDKAIANFKLCAKYETYSADIYAKIGECFEMKDDYSNAVENYRKSIDLDPQKESALIGLTNILHLQGKNKEAIHFVKKHLENDASNSANWLLLAKCEHAFGNEISAIEAYDKSLELNTKSVNTYIEYSNFYFDYEKYDLAFNIAKEGLNTIPDSAILNYMAFVYGLKAGNYKEALSFLENALFLAPEKKDMVFQYFDDIDSQKAILKIIDGII